MLIRLNPLLVGDLNDPLRTPAIFYGNATTRAGVSTDVDGSPGSFVHNVGCLYISSSGQVFQKIAKGASPGASDWGQGDTNASDSPLIGIVSRIVLTGQGDNIGATTIVTPTVATLYRITAYIVVTTVDAVSSTMPKTTISWTDADNSQAETLDLTATSGGNALTTFAQASMLLKAKAAVALQYTTSGYVSNTAHAMKYSLSIVTEAF
jgi:hypothetical protein